MQRWCGSIARKGRIIARAGQDRPNKARRGVDQLADRRLHELVSENLSPITKRRRLLLRS